MAGHPVVEGAEGALPQCGDQRAQGPSESSKDASGLESREGSLQRSGNAVAAQQRPGDSKEEEGTCREASDRRATCTGQLSLARSASRRGSTMQLWQTLSEAVHLLAARAAPAGNVDTASSGWTPLHQAAYYGRAIAAQRLVKLGAPLDCLNEEGNTPLHLACLSRQLPVIKVLLVAGADMDALNDHGHSPASLFTSLEARELFAQERVKRQKRRAEHEGQEQSAQEEAVKARTMERLGTFNCKLRSRRSSVDDVEYPDGTLIPSMPDNTPPCKQPCSGRLSCDYPAYPRPGSGQGGQAAPRLCDAAAGRASLRWRNTASPVPLQVGRSCISFVEHRAPPNVFEDEAEAEGQQETEQGTASGPALAAALTRGGGAPVASRLLTPATAAAASAARAMLPPPSPPPPSGPGGLPPSGHAVSLHSMKSCPSQLPRAGSGRTGTLATPFACGVGPGSRSGSSGSDVTCWAACEEDPASVLGDKADNATRKEAMYRAASVKQAREAAGTAADAAAVAAGGASDAKWRSPERLPSRRVSIRETTEDLNASFQPRQPSFSSARRSPLPPPVPSPLPTPPGAMRPPSPALLPTQASSRRFTSPLAPSPSARSASFSAAVGSAAGLGAVAELRGNIERQPATRQPSVARSGGSALLRAAQRSVSFFLGDKAAAAAAAAAAEAAQDAPSHRPLPPVSPAARVRDCRSPEHMRACLTPADVAALRSKSARALGFSP